MGNTCLEATATLMWSMVLNCLTRKRSWGGMGWKYDFSEDSWIKDLSSILKGLTLSITFSYMLSTKLINLSNWVLNFTSASYSFK